MLFGGFVLLYLLVAGRLAFLQLVRHGEFEDWGAQIRFRRTVLEAQRGCIYDRDKRVLAMSIDSASVYANRNEVKDVRETSRRLAEMLGVSEQSIAEKFSRKSTIVWLAKRVDPRIGREIKLGYKTTVRRKIKGGYTDAEVRLPFMGIGVEWDTKRKYPTGVTAAQVLGFVNNSGRGAEGLECSMNRELSGIDGEMTSELDARRRAIPQSQHTVREPIDGKDVVLTIDMTIQQIAEDALANMAKTYHPSNACAVVLDPNTGEILALANYPFYDPNSPANGNASLWRNRAVADLYEPGSTLKSVTVAAALNEGIDPHAIVACCCKKEKIPGGRITCTVHPPFGAGHGPVDMYKIIQYSCNIGAAHLGFKLGAKKLYSYEKAFGLCDRLHAGFGCEAVGSMLPPEDWRTIRLANIAFGQGIAVTPLQMAGVYGAIANGGVYHEPRVIREIAGPNGSERIKPAPARTVVSRKAAAELTKMLMVCATEGTGKPAQIEGRTVAGKTGSAQIAKRRGGYVPGAFIASFMGFVPATRPRLVIAVVVTRPQGSHWGATVAAPVFHDIGEKALWYLKVPSDAPLTPKKSPKPAGSAKSLA